MVSDLGIKYSSSRNPLFDVGFVLQEQTHLRREGDVRADISSLSMTAYGTVLDGMVNDLWFSIANNGNRVLMVSMHYNQNCFDEETIERLGDALLKIIGAVGKNAQILLGDIELTEKTGNSQTESVSIDLVF
jgi:hypothetical protein